jgi:hypothetical protein
MRNLFGRPTRASAAAPHPTSSYDASDAAAAAAAMGGLRDPEYRYRIPQSRRSKVHTVVRGLALIFAGAVLVCVAGRALGTILHRHAPSATSTARYRPAPPPS